MTPYELTLYHETFQEKREIELKEQLSLVWLGEYYHRTKRLPNLKKELNKISSAGTISNKMSDKEMLEKVRQLNAQFGGTFEKGGA